MVDMLWSALLFLTSVDDGGCVTVFYLRFGVLGLVGALLAEARVFLEFVGLGLWGAGGVFRLGTNGMSSLTLVSLGHRGLLSIARGPSKRDIILLSFEGPGPNT